MVRSVILIILCVYSLEAAAPATHAYLAEKWMEVHQPESSEAFTAGTLFPDIRYLGTVSRKKTHEKGVNPYKIRNTQNSFTAGARYHAWVDVMREHFAEKYGVFKRLRAIPKKSRVLFLKILEDQILWEKGDWQHVLRSLETIYPEHAFYDVTYEVTAQWHLIMLDYFQQTPHEMLKGLAIANQGYLQADAQTVKEWCEILPLYAADPYFITYTEEMVKSLVSRF